MGEEAHDKGGDDEEVSGHLIVHWGYDKALVGGIVKRFLFCYCNVVNRDDFVKWGAEGGKRSARKLGPIGRSKRARRGWDTRRRNGQTKPKPS